jgi:imidazolonepropionase-like amidohydrolase
VLVGTDNPEPQGVGASLHGEMQAFVLAGYAPLEVLRMATHDAAVALGIEASVGTLDAGKLADFVILDEDPLEDITNTRDIWRVVKDGRVYDPADLLPQEREEQ